MDGRIGVGARTRTGGGAQARIGLGIGYPLPSRADGRRRRIGTGRALATLATLALLAPGAHAVEEAHASARVADPPEVVWNLLIDFAHWDRVFPAVTSIVVAPVDERRVRLHTRTNVVGRMVRYTLVAEIDAAARRIDCALDPNAPSDVLALSSRWDVRASAGGGSHIELTVRSESGMGLPRFLERRMTEHSTRQSLGALVAALDEQRHEPARRLAAVD